jgi:hypothetical protein
MILLLFTLIQIVFVKLTSLALPKPVLRLDD